MYTRTFLPSEKISKSRSTITNSSTKLTVSVPVRFFTKRRYGSQRFYLCFTYVYDNYVYCTRVLVLRPVFITFFCAVFSLLCFSCQSALLLLLLPAETRPQLSATAAVPPRNTRNLHRFLVAARSLVEADRVLLSLLSVVLVFVVGSSWFVTERGVLGLIAWKKLLAVQLARDRVGKALPP